MSKANKKASRLNKNTAQKQQNNHFGPKNHTFVRFFTHFYHTFVWIYGLFSHTFAYFPKNKRGFSADAVPLSSALKPRLFKFNLVKIGLLPILLVVSLLYIINISSNNVSATSITLTIPGSLSLDVNPNTNSGYAKSSNGNISVTADSPFGYTLSIKSKDATNGNTLMNGSNKLASIAEALTEDNYKSTGTVNTWGYIPNKVNGSTNTNVRPGPGTSGETIEKTSVANASTANNYTVALATKVDKTLQSGSYKNTFVISAVANSVNYSITYNLESGSWTGTSSQTGSTPENKVKLSSVSPTRSNYTFKGWCDTAVTSNSTASPSCSGTTYSASSDYPLTNSSNEINLYAIWQLDGTAYSITYNINGGNSSSLPSPNPQTGVTTSTSITLSNTKPTRSGYEFITWCTSNPGNSSTCSGTSYNAGASYPLSSGATRTLYATWGKPSMQSFSCSSLSSGTSTTLRDTRDNNEYTVAKLKDGKCWMTQNLRLGKSTTMTLTSADTDIDSTYILPASSTRGFSDDSAQNIFVSTNTSYGGYYTWPAATAGTNPSSGEASHSICPKGWRLPTKTEFDTLRNNYTYTTIRQSPANFVLAGYYYNNSSLNNSGTYGYWWSSTAYSSTNAYDLYLRPSSSYFVTDGNGKRGGFSIRCVSRQ